MSAPAPQRQPKARARALRRSTQLAIAKYKQRNAHLTYGDVAAKYGVTYDQARDACKRYEEGVLGGQRSARKVRRTQPSGNPISLLGTLLDRALTAVDRDGGLTGVEMIELLEKAAPILRTVQQLSLMGHIKGFDSVIFAALVRRYQPNAGDEDIVRIYHEIRQECLAATR
ncbi:MAG TPA: hypothetical protein VHI13_18960 [Candidatus Kapabacteria bacterium]|nr:hypothetical protein [Candidatus Kapabacteria bacterium]